MVIDTSAILALLLEEPAAQWFASALDQSVTPRSMSTVNLTETLIILGDRTPAGAEALQPLLMRLGVDLVPPDVSQAIIAAEARLKFPLNIGDCFVYALAKSRAHPILTVDRDFRSVDVPVLLPPKT